MEGIYIENIFALLNKGVVLSGMLWKLQSRRDHVLQEKTGKTPLDFNGN